MNKLSSSFNKAYLNSNDVKALNFKNKNKQKNLTTILIKLEDEILSGMP